MNGYDVARATTLRDRAIAALRALPGVQAVSTATRLPLAPDINLAGILVPGHHEPGADATPTDAVVVGADYFAAVGVPIVAGRAFSEDDISRERRVAVVNETMARQYWPDATAIGRRLYTEGWTSAPYEVVGVARDHKVRSVGENPRAYVHLPALPGRAIGLLVRTTTPPASALPMLRDAIWRLEPDVLFTEEAPAADVAELTLAPTRLGALAVGSFGALALLLSGVGLYGVIAYTTARRSREVGIRMALGASRRQVLLMVLSQGGRLAAVGVVIGTLLAAVVARVLESLLYGVSGIDPVAYASAAGLLVLVALAANLVPALAAARLDPARALRRD